MARTSIYLIVLAILSAYLYDRYLTFSSILAGRPGKLQKTYNVKSHVVKFGERIRNCEDVLLDESTGIAFLSCDPGRDRWNTVMGTFLPPMYGDAKKDNGSLWIYDYSTPDLLDSKALRPLELTNFPVPVDLHPLGMEYDETTSTLYVINHSRHSGSVIEIFQVSIPQGTAKHVKTFKHPLIQTPNSIYSLGEGKLLVTNDHYMRAAVSPLRSKIETFTNLPGGSIVYTDIHNPKDTKRLARLGFANGITMIDSTTVAVASSSKAAFFLYTWNPTDRSLTLQKYIRVPASVDNLSADSNGKLLLAGHPFAFALMRVAKARGKCNHDGTEEEKKACECTSPSWTAEWTEEKGLRTIYQDSGEEFCSSSTFVRDVKRGVGIVSGLYDRGVLVVKE